MALIKLKRVDSVFDTRKINYSDMTLVKIDPKTCVYVTRGTNIEKFKNAFLKRVAECKEKLVE